MEARRSEPFNAIHSICFNWWMHERRAKGTKAMKSNHFNSWMENEMKLIDLHAEVRAVHSMKFIQWNKINEINLIELNWTEWRYFNCIFINRNEVKVWNEARRNMSERTERNWMNVSESGMDVNGNYKLTVMNEGKWSECNECN